MSRLIAELLDVARIDTGRLSIAPRAVDVDVLVNRCVDSVRATTTRPLEVALCRLPAVSADPDKFTQVVTNLLENGVRHGAGTVTVTARPAGGTVRILVEDQGRGIPAEQRVRVRTKYWTGNPGGSSGLGLYIVNGLVAAHGGTRDRRGPRRRCQHRRRLPVADG